MTPPNLPEKLMLAILLCLSAAGFWYRFRSVVHIVAATKPDPGFSLGDLAPRFRNFVWEVLLQGKVIQQRPAAGVAHAFVFWGFCAFALVTVRSHRSLVSASRSCRASTGSAGSISVSSAVFAIAVAVSILYLAVRRFILCAQLSG